MAIAAILAALAAVLAGVFTLEPNVGDFLRTLVELSAVLGVFTLICAAEASN